MAEPLQELYRFCPLSHCVYIYCAAVVFSQTAVSGHFMKLPDNIEDFMVWFKNQSENHFATLELDKDVYGLQPQKGTKWRSGLTADELNSFQSELGFDFPAELIAFYKTMNGTDLPGVNIYGDRGDPYYYAPIYFSYPEHLATIKRLIDERLKVTGLTIEQLKEKKIPNIFPINDYYFMVIDDNTNPIYYLSIAHRNHDINQPYVYGELWTDSLQNWLMKEAFHQAEHVSDLEEFPNKPRTPNFWTTKTNR